MKRTRQGALFGLVVLASAAAGQDRGYQRMTTADGTRLDYRLVAPPEVQASYPVLLALPPGPQTVGMVDWGWKN